MVDSEILQYFLGVEVLQTLVGIVMSQQIYVVEIMKTFRMIDNKSNNKLSQEDLSPMAEVHTDCRESNFALQLVW